MSTLIDGLSLGAIYALIALGYTMVYGIAKMLNFAHGDIIMVGAYALITTFDLFGNFAVSFVVSIVVCALLGIVIEKIAYKPLRGASPLAVLITAIGVSYLLQSIAQLVYGSKARPSPFPSMGALKIQGVTIQISSVITLVAATAIMILLTVFIKTTRLGRAMFAVSEDRSAAQLMGVNVNMIISVTFAIGSVLAAFASLFYMLQIPLVDPTLGSMPGIKAFTAAVIGGIGSIPGAMVGGLFLGIVEKVVQSIPGVGPYTTAIEFAILILILMFRPTGLLGKKRREKV